MQIKIISEGLSRYQDGMYTATVEGLEDDIAVCEATILIYGSEALIERIDTAEGYRGKGYGTEMLQWAGSITDSVYIVPDNADAARLYDRLGDEADAEWVPDYGYGSYRLDGWWDEDAKALGDRATKAIEDASSYE